MIKKNTLKNLEAIETFFQNVNVDNCDTITIMHEQHKLLIDELVYSDDFVLDSKIRRFVSNIIADYPEFLSSPASSKYHGCVYGGLFNHSLLVYKNALLMHKFYKVDEVNFIACMFHDLCKSDRYKLVSTNSDNKYVINDKYVGIEHGAESLRRLLLMVPAIDTELVPESWQLAIVYHMGVFDVSETEMKNFSKYSEMYPEVLLLHHCDMVAAKIYKS